MMKNSKTKILSVLTVVLIAALMLAPMAGASDGGHTGATITVTGTGVVTIKPDKAIVSVGISSEDKDAKEAQKVNNAAMETLIQAIRDMGIAEDNIVTENYSLYPNYDYSGNTAKIIGYIASHQLNITVLDIDTVGNVIDTAIGAGANQSYGVSFGVQDESEYYQEALKKAVAVAQPKAQAIAEASGQQLGDILAIVEGGSAPNVLRYAEAETAAYDSAGGMSVQSGTLDITAMITIAYAVK